MAAGQLTFLVSDDFFSPDARACVAAAAEHHEAMATKTTWTFASRVVLLCGLCGIGSAACGDTGTPVDNTGASRGSG
ncbi:MAG: hypothetical protein M3O36_10350, partial [Myxococcota bacterium]|nr:hypothetical protein [Myxococcota bacterium]